MLGIDVTVHCDHLEEGACHACIDDALSALRARAEDAEAQVSLAVGALAGLSARLRDAERLAAERLEVLRQIGQVAGLARATVQTESDDRALARIQQLSGRASGAGGG